MNWIKLNVQGPSARAANGAVLDGALVVVGGLVGGGLYPEDVWRFDGAWAQRGSIPQSMTPLAYPGVASDSTYHSLWIQGGVPEAPSNAPRNESWQYLEGIWARGATAPGDLARDSHTMTYDPVRKRLVIIGGRTETGILGDVWELPEDGRVWERAAAQPPPAFGARYAHRAVYSPVLGGILVLGGKGGKTGSWLYTGARWMRGPFGGPSMPRSEFGLALDTARGVIVLFGGSNTTTPTYYDDTWELTGNMWHRVETAQRPVARTHTLMGYVAGVGLTLFGGNFGFGSYAADTWVLR